MSDLGDKQRLLDAAQAAVTDAREKEEARARQRVSTPASRGIMFGASLALFLVAVYLAAVRPAWFMTPPPAPDPPALQEASVRLTLVRESQRIQAWRSANGRLPANLSEAGIPVSGLAYDRLDDSTWAVSLPFGASQVTLRSTDSVAAFLGSAVGTVAARVTP
jgi:hypothetical protein